MKQIYYPRPVIVASAVKVTDEKTGRFLRWEDPTFFDEAQKKVVHGSMEYYVFTKHHAIRQCYPYKKPYRGEL